MTVRPFRAVRPKPELVSKVAELPYDVMNTEEARQIASGNPHSFLRVDKAEIDLPPETDQYDAKVYAKAKENLQSLIKTSMIQDDKPCFYIYRLTGYGQTQTGLAACVSTAEYEQGLIKRHEFTRPDKEQDRVNHMVACEAHTGPIFLAYRSQGESLEKYAQEKPAYDFTSDDGVRHELWVIDCEETQNALISKFEKMPALYIADGHHRNATAAILANMRNKKAATPLFCDASSGAPPTAAERSGALPRVARGLGGVAPIGDGNCESSFLANKENHDSGAEHNFYLAVIFPHDELAILDYNRVVKDLNGMNIAAFLDKLSADWNVEKSDSQVKPERKYIVGMYLEKQWYRLTVKNPPPASSAIESLDCSVLQDSLLSPLLGIGDPRTDKRIDFVGGIRGLGELEKRVNSGEMTVAFALYPTSMDELMAVADANQIMPPKSTWFEPKLRSGLLVHLF